MLASRRIIEPQVHYPVRGQASPEPSGRACKIGIGTGSPSGGPLTEKGCSMCVHAASPADLWKEAQIAISLKAHSLVVLSGVTPAGVQAKY